MDYTETSRVDPEQTTSAEQFDRKAFFTEHLRRAEDGKYEIQGDDLSPVELALLETEKRRRGSQAIISREKVRADKAELAMQKALEAVPNVQARPSVDESLKYSDPDEYIRLTLEAQRANPYGEVFDTAQKQAADEVGQRTVEDEIRLFNENNPNQQVTLEQLELDVPARLINDFSEGKLSPQDFLGRAADMLYKPATTHNVDIPVTPDLGEVGGQTAPTDDGSNDAMLANYASAIF